MNDNERILISVLGNSICAGTGCDDCHNLFRDRKCPLDLSIREERFNFCAKIVSLLETKGIKEFTDDELLDILLGE